ncbi:MAG: hypothetical protein U0T77_03045 [Chitinophagales bacterium]
MSTFNIRRILLFIILFWGVSGCRKEPRTPAPEQELITTLRITFTDTTAPYTSYSFSFTDIDGEGGEPPVQDSILLPKNRTYNATLLLLDERDFPADTVTNEIIELGEEHQFFFMSSPAELLNSISYLDADKNGFPIGNAFRCATSNTLTNGSFRITLRHEPAKNAAGVASGDITNADGESDIEVEFPVRLY